MKANYTHFSEKSFATRERAERKKKGKKKPPREFAERVSDPWGAGFGGVGTGA